jgi:hypothetical protein
VSTFDPTIVRCPSCGDERERQVARSVNAERSPHLRAAILECTFQRVDCEACGECFELAAPFLYVHFARRQWLLCAPPAADTHDAWAMLEQEFAQAARHAASVGVPELFEGVRPRLVCGLLGLREQLLCDDAGIDTKVLEGFKRALVGELGREADLCLVEREPEELSFLLLGSDPPELVQVPVDEWSAYSALETGTEPPAD